MNRNSVVKQKAPIVTVLMPVHNGEKYLKDALDSIINQTFRDFEFLIINDASTDASREIIKSYPDSRIRLIDNETNLGVTGSLNKGLRLAQGDFVARMDADDFASKDRLQCQVGYFEDHPQCAILFTGFRTSTGYVSIPPSDVRDQKWAVLFGNPMSGHSTVMFRRQFVINHLGGYNESFASAQDYDLWARALSQGIRIGVVPKILVTIRKHKCSVSTKLSETQNELAEKVSCREIEKICPEISKRMAQVICRIWSQRRTASELLSGPLDAWRLRLAIARLISRFAAMHGLGRDWQDSQALEFASRSGTDVYHAVVLRSLNFGLFCELLGCLTVNIHRPVFNLYMAAFLFGRFVNKLRQRRNRLQADTI